MHTTFKTLEGDLEKIRSVKVKGNLNEINSHLETISKHQEKIDS